MLRINWWTGVVMSNGCTVRKDALDSRGDSTHMSAENSLGALSALLLAQSLLLLSAEQRVALAAALPSLELLAEADPQGPRPLSRHPAADAAP